MTVSCLSLLVFLVAANHPHDAAAPHDLAFVANPSDRCPDFHSSHPRPTRFNAKAAKRSYNFSTIRPRPASTGESSSLTRSPTSSRTKLRSIRSAMCASTSGPSSSRTLYIALGSVSCTTPVSGLIDRSAKAFALRRLCQSLGSRVCATLPPRYGGGARRDRYRRAPTGTSRAVRIHGPSAVTATVCSKCADRLLSRVTAVQP